MNDLARIEWSSVDPTVFDGLVADSLSCMSLDMVRLIMGYVAYSCGKKTSKLRELFVINLFETQDIRCVAVHITTGNIWCSNFSSISVFNSAGIFQFYAFAPAKLRITEIMFHGDEKVFCRDIDRWVYVGDAHTGLLLRKLDSKLNCIVQNAIEIDPITTEMQYKLTWGKRVDTETIVDELDYFSRIAHKRSKRKMHNSTTILKTGTAIEWEDCIIHPFTDCMYVVHGDGNKVMCLDRKKQCMRTIYRRTKKEKRRRVAVSIHLAIDRIGHVIIWDLPHLFLLSPQHDYLTRWILPIDDLQYKPTTVTVDDIGRILISDSAIHVFAF